MAISGKVLTCLHWMYCFAGFKSWNGNTKMPMLALQQSMYTTNLLRPHLVVLIVDMSRLDPKCVHDFVDRSLEDICFLLRHDFCATNSWIQMEQSLLCQMHPLPHLLRICASIFAALCVLGGFHFYLVPGQYRHGFNMIQLQHAHDWCFSRKKGSRVIQKILEKE